MAMRPLFAASILGLSLILSTGCGTTTTPTSTPTETTQQTPQPTQTVAITDEKPPAEEPGPAKKTEPAKGMKHPEIARIAKDPFVNPFAPGQDGVKFTPGPGKHTPTNPNVPGIKPNPGDKKNGEVADVAPEPPDFEVRGLVRGNQGMVALLKVEDKTQIVSNGQKLGEYQIASIDNRGVTVSCKGHKFRVKIKNEFGL